jgi:hypothetical protein
MNAREYILEKQINWAKNHGINLVGSKGDRGLPAYTKTLNDNLFMPLSPEAMAEFSGGDGNELKGIDGSMPKMQAVHSSSALGVNIFEYWRQNGLVHMIAAECELCHRGNTKSSGILYEQKYEISPGFGKHPNIDVVIENAGASRTKVFGIECKFSEAYSGGRDKTQKGLESIYLDLPEIWDDIPTLRTLAEEISPADKRYKYLHPAQLIKHILGLKNKYGKNGFRVLYLWYDALGEEGAIHRNEIRDFKACTRADEVRFHSITHQELICKMSDRFREKHAEYIAYLTNRYL